jgi:hypothetical protein
MRRSPPPAAGAWRRRRLAVRAPAEASTDRVCSSGTGRAIDEGVTTCLLLLSRRAALVAPLRTAGTAAGLHVVVRPDPTGAQGIPDVSGIVVDVDALASHRAAAERWCDALRAGPGRADVPIVFVGDGSVVGSTADALAVGGDAFFALPVDAGRIVAKILAYGTGALPPLPPLPIPPVTTSRTPAVAPAATPDELLAALEGAGALPASDEPDVRDDDNDDDVEESGGAAAVPASNELDPRWHAAHGACRPGEPAALLWDACARGLTGSLELLDDEGTRRGILLVAGQPVAVRSTAPAEQPDALVQRLGLVPTARLEALRARGALPRRAGALVTLLVDRGALMPEERADVVHAVLVEQLTAWVGGTGGAWQRRDGADDNDDAIDVVLPRDGRDGVAGIVVEALRRRFPEVRLAAVVGGLASILRPAGRALPAAIAAVLHADERRAIAGCDGGCGLDELLWRLGVPLPTLLRGALVGLVFGHLARDGGPAITDPRIIAAALDERRARARLLHRERIEERLTLARGDDYFRLLSLSEDATAHEIVGAAARMRARFDPARAAERGVPELRTALVEIVDVVAEAEAALLDDEVRAAHARRPARGTPDLP